MRCALPQNFRFIHQIAATPLVPVQLPGCEHTIWCKLEFLNPSGSTKDRIARYILEKAWREGRISEGSTVVEASSGSTSIALALACAQMGLRFVAFIPDSATNERSLIIKAYGGEVCRISGTMSNVLVAAANAANDNNWFAANQFANLDNVEAHRVWTGQEILSQVDGGRVDAVVSGVGTGGTLRGLWESFTNAGCECLPFAAIPQEGTAFGDAECCSIRFSCQVPGVADGISELYADWKDEAVSNGLVELAVPDCDALSLTRQLWESGFPVGPSSGLNYGAALMAAERMPPESVIVTVLPDRMERYFSHSVFDECR